MRLIAILAGLILLLPGACSLFVMALTLPNMFSGRFASDDAPLVLLWLICFAISFGGFLMIRYGVKR